MGRCDERSRDPEPGYGAPARAGAGVWHHLRRLLAVGADSVAAPGPAGAAAGPARVAGRCQPGSVLHVGLDADQPAQLVPGAAADPLGSLRDSGVRLLQVAGLDRVLPGLRIGL